MHVFGTINDSATLVEQNTVNYTHNFTTSSEGIKSIKVVSGSSLYSGSYWDSLNVLFYTSGSPVYVGENKFAKPSSNLSLQSKFGTQYLHKFHGYQSSSVIQVPQQYYGEKIKERSFTFTDLNNSDNDGNNPIIKDDGFGNLYSTNAHHSQSINSLGETGSISSSVNYVGNIFYEKGLAVITETGSWSGSINYSDLATNYTIKLDSSNTITTYEYEVTISPIEYNHSTNYQLRSPLSGSDFSLGTSHYATTFTGSDFQPYITQINLWNSSSHDSPVIQANLPKPIRKSKKIATTFKIRLDI
tara:strand:- start:45 stop:947 length:903 start_codon:yes stop_codon:yes gene_type:complete